MRCGASRASCKSLFRSRARENSFFPCGRPLGTLGRVETLPRTLAASPLGIRMGNQPERTGQGRAVVSASRPLPARRDKQPEHGDVDGGRFAVLTLRERAVADAVARGESNKQIAASLGISPFTVRDHVSSLLVKLGARSRAGLAARVAVAVALGDCVPLLIRQEPIRKGPLHL